MNSNEEPEDIVIKRRIDRRLEERAKSDRPWLRRTFGLTIIALSFLYGWRLLNRKTDQIVELHSRQTQQAQQTQLKPSTEGEPAKAIDATAPIATADVSPPQAHLDGPTLNTIAECTRKENAFRRLDFNKQAIAQGEATLESIFEPVLNRQEKRVSRKVLLQTVRIRLKNGDELRLHAEPKNKNDRHFDLVDANPLHLKLFRVVGDDLPKETEFPESIRDLKDKPLSDHAITAFLQLAETPGQALEVERHEHWKLSGTTTALLIWRGEQIHDMQIFMPRRFLSCSRGVKSGVANVACKCVERTP